MKADHFRQM